MAKSEAVRLAQIQLQAQREKQSFEILKAAFSNPIVELVAGFTLVEFGQRYPTGKPLFTGTQGNLMQATMAGLITAQQIAPLIPSMAAGGESVLKLLPALAAL